MHSCGCGVSGLAAFSACGTSGSHGGIALRIKCRERPPNRDLIPNGLETGLLSWNGSVMCRRRRALVKIRMSIALAALCICPNICRAQQAGSIDLTQIEARDELRRPPVRKGDPTGLRGIVEPVGSCDPVPKDAPAVQTTLVWVDRNRYSAGDDVKFEVRILNTGSVPLKLPFSPHLADLQPGDPGRKFAYFKMWISLELSSVLHNVGFTAPSGGGSVALYGDEKHSGTMLTLLPGEWVQVIGEGEFMAARSAFKRRGQPLERHDRHRPG